MYIPRHFRWKDTEQVREFIGRYPFAQLITGGDLPLVTHLPFVNRIDGDTLVLRSHMARENPQWQHMDGAKVLVVFLHPHAYIMPSWYESEINVPTWNYLAVHCYGTCRVLPGQPDAEGIMKEMFSAFDEKYIHQYDRLPADYKDKLFQALVAFEIEVDDVQAKAKVSQNKRPSEQVNIHQQLSQKEGTVENELAEWMNKIYNFPQG